MWDKSGEIFINLTGDFVFEKELFILENFLKGKKHVHFIGIGGSGMYPLAQILHTKGYYLTGSDNNETATLDAVRKMGIPVYMGQSAENIGDADCIVYSAAIMDDNPAFFRLARRNKLGIIVHNRRGIHNAVRVADIFR